jgi:YHS domain-containing protein
MKPLRNLLLLGNLIAAVFLGTGTAGQAEERVALKGYDPVAYFTESRATPGTPQFHHEWDGATYRFASAKHLELFKADPDRYLPQYHNWCAASMAKGVKQQGHPEYWLVVDGRLYLFAGPPNPAMSRADLAGLKIKADDNWSKISKLPDAVQR